MIEFRLPVRPSRARLVGAVVAAVLVATGGVVLGAASPALAQGTPTPWAPGGVDQDTNGVGGLTFYNAAGTPITSGSTNTAPFAAYAVGGKTLRTQDDLSAAFLFTPQKGVDPSQWNGSVLGPSSTFPNTAAPAPVNAQTTPTTTGATNDLTLEDVSDSQTTSTDAGYANVFEVRQLTAKKRAGQSVAYNYADVLIDQTAHTWTLVWTPSSATAPASPSAVSVVAGSGSATVSWTAPTDNGGADLTGYVVEYSKDDGAHWTSVPEKSTSTSAVITGLSGGVPYVFRVAAVNSAGTSGYSASSAAVTPSATASRLTIAGPASAKYNAVGTLSAQLTDAVTRGVLANQTISLLGRANTHVAWARVATVRTNSHGQAAVRLHLTADRLFEWTYAATAMHRAATSATRSVTVSQTISEKATAKSVRAKKLIKVYGTVTPAGNGQRVYLQVYNHGWKTVSSTTVHSQKLPNKKRATGFVLSVHPGKGSKKYRVYKPLTATLAAGYSGQFTLAGK